MTDDELRVFGRKIVEYCDKFDVPLKYLFQILEDQKVTPMIRGKAMEYNAAVLLKGLLNPDLWTVDKLNLNPQPGIEDEDISVTHRRTGRRLKVESKSAVRGSMTDGVRCRDLKDIPHFKVKCHRSRSNKSLPNTNDAYSEDSFDVLLTNPQNAIYKGGTVGEDFEIVEGPELRTLLNDFYHVRSNADLAKACYKDWRFCFPPEIAVDGFIPRTPSVRLTSDPIWKPVAEIEARLDELVTRRRRRASRRG
jgi:hypothetical protein